MKSHSYHKNIVVVGLKYYGRNVKRRTNGFAKDFLKENIDKSHNCPYCNVLLNNDNITADHIIPVSKGGNNTKVNLLSVMAVHNYTFISFEPLLGDMSQLFRDSMGVKMKHIDLLIVGAMTGAGAIPPKKEWIDSIKHKNI